MMKQRILQSIYHVFDSWTPHLKHACRRGCTTCCSRNVTITSLEAECIINYIHENNQGSWLKTKIQSDLPQSAPSCTTNEYALACLNGTDIELEESLNSGACPFLEEGGCSIYPARPFSCRSFASTEMCRPGSRAVIDQYYLTAVTAVSQIIEHLDQRNFWGNMLHILYLLAQQNETTEDTDYPANRQRFVTAQTSCLTAKPLPGFLIPEEDYPYTAPLIQEIFDTETEGKRIEDILNNT